MGENVTDDEYIPDDIRKAAEEATNCTLPAKSKVIYKKVYSEFVAWQELKKTKSCNEKVLLAYFHHLSTTLSSATMWSKFSMIKSMLKLEKNIDIGNYGKLRNYLKQTHTGYTAKKSKTLSPEDVSKFIETAPNIKYLSTKVALILGITGACRREELYNMKIDDIRKENSTYVVHIPHTKTHTPRTFVVEGKYCEFINEYINARPSNLSSNKFFVCYRNGKIVNQVIGINKIGAMPQEIAAYLQLPDANNYTGHSFRRTSATFLANAGASMTTLKRHGGWKSSNVAEGYIEDSLENKRKICNQITSAVDNSSNQEKTDDATPSKRKKVDGNDGKTSVTVDVNNCVVQ